MTLLLVIPGWYWLGGIVAILIGFAIPEAIAIRNKQGGDTLSENIRRWFRTDTPGGGKSWFAVWLTLVGVLVWLYGHIERLWP